MEVALLSGQNQDPGYQNLTEMASRLFRLHPAAKGERVMDEELKRYLDGMADSLQTALEQMEIRIIAAMQKRDLPFEVVPHHPEGEHEGNASAGISRIKAGY
jgi:hypothetical protein